MSTAPRGSTGRLSDRAASDESRLEQLEGLAHLLDTRWQVPGTSWRFGIDGVAGLLPGVGDMATGIVSVYLIWQAKRMGVPRSLLLRMAGNVGLDVLLGSVPVLGSIFDFAFKSNVRNLRLLHRHLDRKTPRN